MSKTEFIDIEKAFNILNIGDSIIIPTNQKHIIKANVRFKTISTIIKSGYEE